MCEISARRVGGRGRARRADHWLAGGDCGAQLAQAVLREEVAAGEEAAHEPALRDVLLEERDRLEVVDVEEGGDAREHCDELPLDDGHLHASRGVRKQ